MSDPTATAATGTGADHDCGDAGDCPIHDGLTPYEAHLYRENQRLRDEVREMWVRPLPRSDVPGYDVWRALMEDLREAGEARLAVRAMTVMEVTYEPA